MVYNDGMSNLRTQIFGLTVAAAIAFRAFGCCGLPAQIVGVSSEKGCCQSNTSQPHSVPADCCCKDDVSLRPDSVGLTVAEPLGSTWGEPLVHPVEHGWNFAAADNLCHPGPEVRILQCVWLL